MGIDQGGTLHASKQLCTEPCRFAIWRQAEKSRLWWRVAFPKCFRVAHHRLFQYPEVGFGSCGPFPFVLPSSKQSEQPAPSQRSLWARRCCELQVSTLP